MGIHNNALIGASGQQGYQISRSVRLRSSASAYLNRTFGTPTSGTTWTWSGWVKLGTIGSGTLFEAGTGASNTFMRCTFGQVSQELNWRQVTPVGGLPAEKGTTQLFRDPSAWYHIVCVWDTNNGTAADRQRVYVNGVQVTAFSASTNPSSGLVSYFNTSGYVHYLGALNISGLSGYLDGYLTEINFVDGQALTPSSFGETNAITGVWQPKKYSGTYGTNGFYLNFSDNSASTATTIGKDYSGNGNNWTPNNISVTAGVTYDSMLDVPTVGATSSNYAVLNPLSLGSTVTLSNANLTMTEVGTYATTVSSIGVTSGKWYAEMTVGSNTYAGTCGIARLGYSPTSRLGFQANTWAYNSDGGLYYNSTQLTPTQATFTTGDVIGIELDVDNLTIKFYKNNALQTQFYTAANSALTAGEFYFATGHINSTSNWNFGQRPFTYTPPTGFLALNTQNLPDSTIKNGAAYMAATLYTGNGTSQTVNNSANGVSFQPDFVWIKNRTAVLNHNLVNSVTGATRYLELNTNATEVNNSGVVSAITSTGFSVGTASSTNGSTNSLVAWQWNAGGSTVTNTSGSISAQVRANPTAGFSVVTFTGTGANATVGHGLGVAPRMIIIKRRSAAGNWSVYHASLPSVNHTMYLNSTNAQASDGSTRGSAPSSNTFSVGTDLDVNANGTTFVNYCFAAVAGYSAFGSYTGNGSADGPFVYTAMRPRWIMLKRTDTAGFPWWIFDTSRNTYNVADLGLYANGSDSESSGGFPYSTLDLLSNGFKLRATAGGVNASGGTYIYAAFAENPFKNSLAR